ncbi:MAG: nuclear transport factor 2 family protein [Desulfobacteraceae bacterium]|nr:MAG: nuclear transport factor 2 family protein [Desulfobacteraceae bacterium]
MEYGKTVEQYWQTLNDRDWQAFGALLHEGMVYEIPQTRERVRGKEAYIDFNKTYPGDWTLAIVHLVADQHRAVSQIAFRDDGQEQVGISFFEFKDGLICRITDFWPVAYEPPLRQSRFIERY